MSPIEKKGSTASLLNFKAHDSMEDNSGSDSEAYDSDVEEFAVSINFL